jgi:hypothetical protein
MRDKFGSSLQNRAQSLHFPILLWTMAKWARFAHQDHCMGFRLKAFGWHLAASGIALTLLLGTLYVGWYRWPGWYLADASQVVLVLAGVDLVVGPLLTLVIANSKKPRRELVRDIAIIAAVQLVALGYGTVSLWNGRPLFYAFSENVLQLVQAYDIEPQELELARAQNAPLIPHWYSVPRWIWAPLPADTAEREKIVASAVSGGSDVIGMPRYYRRWDDGLPQLRGQLKTVDDVAYFTGKQKAALKQRLQTAGFAPDQFNAIPLTGRGKPLLAVFDLKTLTVAAIFQGS